MKYFVHEIQIDADGNVSIPAEKSYEDRAQADSAFFMVASAVAISQLAVHTVMMFNEKGEYIQRPICYDRRKPEPASEV